MTTNAGHGAVLAGLALRAIARHLPAAALRPAAAAPPTEPPCAGTDAADRAAASTGSPR